MNLFFGWWLFIYGYFMVYNLIINCLRGFWKCINKKVFWRFYDEYYRELIRIRKFGIREFKY